MTTTGDQGYIARAVNFDPPVGERLTLDHGGVLSMTTGLPAPGQPVDPTQVDSFNNINRIERGVNARLDGDMRSNPAWTSSSAPGRFQRILPPPVLAAPALTGAPLIALPSQAALVAQQLAEQRSLLEGALGATREAAEFSSGTTLEPAAQPAEILTADVTVGDVQTDFCAEDVQRDECIDQPE